MAKTLKIIELFAGVGGFRVGLEEADKEFFQTVWANQWEPATKIQHAAAVYKERFGHICNEDINTVKTEDIPEHDMLVGGFPCQDYSVATTLSNSKGIEGKKGVPLQDILAEQWKPYMQNLDTMYTDATCYESEMRYPTDPKLLWEGIEKSYETMCELSKRLRIHRPRTKFIDVQKANLAFRKQRKHSKSQTRKMTRRLLELLGKILKEIRKTERAYENAQSLLTTREKSDLEIITKMYRQQKNHFQSKDCRESIPNRIVSISKPYVRPIVRGKEVKSVEFGAKVNNILVDGISFIEKLSFNAFNEGTRLIHCLKMHKRLFGVEAKKVGGDTGYAGTDNRDYCKENGIQTSFVKRGRPFSEEKKGKDLVRKELAKVRATAMEGSFGTQKEHYDLRRVKARTKLTEILYIFFGIHTANVVQLADRIEQRVQLAVA